MDGILLVDKPRGWTSHDIVALARGRLKLKKAGHAGTLDPMATGLLVLLLGRATKDSASLTGLDKDYEGTIRLGTVTDTWDLEGKVLSEYPVSVSRHELEAAVAQLRGEVSITPPSYSALKKEGKKYYELARKGLMLAPPERKVHIADLRVESYQAPEVGFVVSCSKGTYVRSLAHQLGAKLGCGACLSSLRRTRVGGFGIRDAVSVDEIRSETPDLIEKRLFRLE